MVKYPCRSEARKYGADLAYQFITLIEEAAMATFLLLSTLSGDGRRALEEYPEKLKELNKEVEYMGVKIVAQYALLGQYDFVTIVEAPSNEKAAELAIHMSAGGLQSLTLAAIPLDKLIEQLKKKPPVF
jgi:uncharacterized protein with GYD domain